jgi:outer membrane protein insertion porin family
MRAWLPGLFLFTALCPAQSPSIAYPLTALNATGNKHFTLAQIQAASGLKLGQPVAKDNFDAARARLLETGGFESVSYEFHPNAARNGYDGTFEVAEVALIYKYRFEDLPAPEADLRAALTSQEPLFASEIPATPHVLSRYNLVLTKFLSGKVDVQGRLNHDLPGEPQILFRPAGERPHVSFVTFTGNEAVPLGQLASAISGAAVGSEFTEEAFRRLLDRHVRPLYEAKGRIRVSFPKIASEPAKEPYIVGLALTVTVNEGPAYDLGAVTFPGVAAKQTKELDDLAGWHKGDTVNFDEINAGLERIRARYRSTGYLKVTAKADRTIDDKEHTVAAAVTIEPGAQYTYGNLDVQGLDLFGEPAVRKLWGERSGKPFDAAAPDAFVKRIVDERMFDNLGKAEAAAKVNDATRTVDVTLTFGGAKPGGRRPGTPLGRGPRP